MRCSHCGQDLSEGETVCPRCHADLTQSARLHGFIVSVAYALAGIAIVALLTYYVLSWYELQIHGITG